MAERTPLDASLQAMPAVEQFGPAVLRLALASLRDAAPRREDAPRIVMFLTPWYRQGAAWFAVSLGIAIAARAGARVEFLINDLAYPWIHPKELDEVAALDAFCGKFEAIFPTHRLSAYAGMPSGERRATIDGIVDESLRIDIRHRTGAGTLPRGQAAAFRLSARTPLTHLATACDRFLSTARPDVLFCPGGAANGTYAVRLLAALHAVRFASADSNLGIQYLACHSIAGHLAENADTHAYLMGLPPQMAQRARTEGAAILEKRMSASGLRPGALPRCDLLLLLGYDWDTGALGIGSLYDTQNEWLIDTVEHVTRTHPALHMVVRHHPVEATYPSPENTELTDTLERRGLGTLHIMRATDQAPVYGLLKSARAVVACQSTVVLEAQAWGVPGMCMRDAHYVHAGVLNRPQTREDYFTWLDAHLRGTGTAVSREARDAAALHYFIMEACMNIHTRFTPHAADLWVWLNTAPEADLRSEEVADIVRCVVADVPITTIKARRVLGLTPLPDGVRDPVAA